MQSTDPSSRPSTPRVLSSKAKRGRGLVALLGIFVLALVVIGSPDRACAEVVWQMDARIDSIETGGASTPVVVVDITLRNTAALRGLAASVYGYDRDVIRLLPEASVVSSYVLVEFPTGPGTGWGGLDGNGVLPLAESDDPTGRRTRLFEGRQLRTGGTTQTGELDLSPITGLAGDPQFRLVFEILMLGSTPLVVGSGATGDAVIFPDGRLGGPSETSLLVVTPEPGSGVLLLLGLAGLAGKRPRRALPRVSRDPIRTARRSAAADAA